MQKSGKSLHPFFIKPKQSNEKKVISIFISQHFYDFAGN